MNPSTYLQNLRNLPNYGIRFEEFCVEYLRIIERSTIAEVYMNKDIPESLLLEMNWYRRDLGQDLVYKTHDRRYGLIQCKYRSNIGSQLGYNSDKLANFFAQIKVFQKRSPRHNAPPIIITNIADPSSAFSVSQHSDVRWICYKDVVDPIVRPVIDILLNQNNDPHFTVAPKISLNHHQVRAYTQIMTQKHLKGIVKAPCAFGKTVLMSFILMTRQDTKPARFIVVAPKLKIVGQTHKMCIVIFSQNNVKFSSFTFASEGLTKDDLDEGWSDFSISTDQDELKEFCRESNNLTQIIFTTYQSLPKVKEVIQGNCTMYVYDEGHQIRNLSILDLSCQHLLFTATPSDNLSHLPLYFNMGLGDAIKAGLLVDYEILALSLKTDMYLDQSIDKTSFKARYHARIIQEGLKRQYYKRILVFTETIKSANKLYTELIKLGVITVKITSDDKQNNRSLKEKTIEGAEQGVLVSVMIYREGTDLPFIDAVFYSAAIQQHIGVVQTVGRCLRLYNGKEKACVVIPVIVGESYIDTKNPEYKAMVKFIKEMSEEDTDFYTKTGNSIRLSKLRSLILGNSRNSGNTKQDTNEENPELLDYLTKDLYMCIYKKSGEKIGVLSRKWRTAVLLGIITVMDDEGKFTASELKYNAKGLQKWIGASGKTPQQTMSATLTVDIMGEGLVVRVKKGIYQFKYPRITVDIFKSLFGMEPCNDLLTFPSERIKQLYYDL